MGLNHALVIGDRVVFIYFETSIAMQKGTFIQSTALLGGDYFENALIYISGYDEKGATGFVVNKKFPRSFNELQEFRHSPSFPVYEGGPVDREHLFVLHRRPELITESVCVSGTIYTGGNFSEAVKHINNKTLTAADMLLFIGYCGWDAGELEAEIAEGSWEIVSDQPEAAPGFFFQ